MPTYEMIKPKSEAEASTKKQYHHAVMQLAYGLTLNGIMALALLAIAPTDPTRNQAFFDLIYSAPMLLIVISLMAAPILLFPEAKKSHTQTQELNYEEDEHPFAEAFKWRNAVKRLPAIETSPDRPLDFFYPPQQSRHHPAPLLENMPDRVAEAGQTYLISYQDFDGNVTNREITIVKIYQEARVVYIYAYCHLRNENRTFRRDRIIGDIADMNTGEIVSAETLIGMRGKPRRSGRGRIARTANSRPMLVFSAGSAAVRCIA